jgi:hypothetical protein
MLIRKINDAENGIMSVLLSCQPAFMFVQSPDWKISPLKWKRIVRLVCPAAGISSTRILKKVAMRLKLKRGQTLGFVLSSITSFQKTFI